MRLYGYVFVLGFAALVCEGTALFWAVAVYGGRDIVGGYWPAAGLHATAAAVLLGLSRLAVAQKHTPLHYYALLTAWMTLFLPGLGLLGCVLALVWARWITKAKGMVDEAGHLTFDAASENDALGAVGDPNLFFQDELSTEPVLDILSGQDENLKRGAVHFLGRLGTADAIHLLKRCLADPSSEVRFTAHSTINRLDNDFGKRLKTAQRQVETETGDLTGALAQLADIYDQYAHSGLIEDDTQQHYFGLAKETYLKVVKRDSKNPAIWLKLGRLGTVLSDFDQAEAYFKKALQQAPGTVEPLLGLCRLYYIRKDMGAFQATVKQIRQHENQETADLDQNLQLHFWADASKG